MKFTLFNPKMSRFLAECGHFCVGLAKIIKKERFQKKIFDSNSDLIALIVILEK